MWVTSGRGAAPGGFWVGVGGGLGGGQWGFGCLGALRRGFKRVRVHFGVHGSNLGELLGD